MKLGMIITQKPTATFAELVGYRVRLEREERCQLGQAVIEMQTCRTITKRSRRT